MNVAITYNIKKKETLTENLPPDFYAEWDDDETIDAIRDAVSKRHEVVLIEADKEGYQKLVKEKPDMVFNIAEGINGRNRESHIPAMLEMLGIPYTGSGPLTLGICLDKARAKEILSYYNIPTARFFVSHSALSAQHSALSFPLIVKPLYEGSSKGIRNDSIVYNIDDLNKKTEWVINEYRQPALVEEFLDGREFTVAVMGNGDEVNCLPIVEINYSTLPEGVNPIYSYEAKWLWDTPDNPLEIFTCPAQIEAELTQRIEEICKRAFQVLDIKDWCRIDIRLDGKGTPHILELNPLPGILPDPKSNSCFPKAARAAGMDYNRLINTVLDIACKRYGIYGNR
ncbi:MAG: D-alanine--D-alanine ligase [Deltaproteobacteria bacterium GWC2_42_11]|nr:MAG: D-alanine--D-alanine ligase [Deltaproteobacteria bacterium GWC2_42_11]HBO83626.1 D-alanine--D-alanine ligase [Deltaproteobacteria bacterium]